jgi:Selenocysteine synthase [seryl-tRNASer selenium transferase]
MSTDRPRPPSVERLLAAVRPLLPASIDRDALTAVAREVVGDERAKLAAAEPASDLDALAGAIVGRLDGFADPFGREHGLTTVLNATGVILHTNLGRAPWPKAAIEAATRAAAGYSLLEFDRDGGRRGPRFRAVEVHLIALTGAEDALVTVNNAAALALTVGLAGKRGVAVSRGELVEIGGGVRIPEIVRRTGARASSRSGRRTGRARPTLNPRWPTDARSPCSASTRRTSRSPGSSRHPTRSNSLASPTYTAPSSWTTSAAGRCWRRRRSAWRTSRRRPSA